MLHIRRMNANQREFIAHLRQVDPILHKVVLHHGEITLPDAQDPFTALCRAIIGQQLSTRAAATIFQRFHEWSLTELPSFRNLPSLIQKADDNTLRSLGVSPQKISYLRALSQTWIAHPELYTHLDEKSNEEILRILCAIKGVGEWTAQMFLIFTLHRPDVFAPGDLGIKKAMGKLYGIPMASSINVFTDQAEIWSPYRSLACLHLWRSLDTP